MSTPKSPVESIFFAALQKPSPPERAAYLDEACGADGELRRRVERLLDAHPEVGSFLEGGGLGPVVTVDEPICEGPGTVIGPYKLLEQIGEGGFGVVFMAEQLRPVRRKVALKVLKPGMDTRQVIARFEAERQALALMEHPHIARVLDGGETATGRPYFVMELVRGIRITDYCDEKRLTPRERLELFVPVCQAVQHAHQKGIIHRDLKPSNVLVTLHDGVPVAKVIDFGLAKATGQQLTDKTLFTGFAQLVGTPLYMSPEQAEMSGLDVDTRTDVYSLGVLLYELLTGTTPFEQERLRQTGFDEIRRIIREEEPPPPSTRITTLGQAVTTVCTQRQSDPRRLRQLLRGDLDWVVMKALEKNRNRRYESASALAADVRRYLSDEPVEASPPSMVYRLRKFARRNRMRLTAAALVLTLGLFVVGILAAFHLQKAGRMRQLEQDVQQALAGARTAIDAGSLTVAGHHVAEAQGHLGTERASLPGLAADIDRLRDDIEARQVDEDRFRRFVKLASDAQDKMEYWGNYLGGDHLAREALGLYGVLAEDKWFSRLEKSHLTDAQKQQIRETAYITLVCLADLEVRWDKPDHPRSAPRSLDLLKRAQAFHEPTRAFYFVRSECHHFQGNTAAAEADQKQFRAAVARTAWDYYLPGHTAGWNGDVDEALRAYRAALRVQPDHFNSLFFLAYRLSERKKEYREAIGLWTAISSFRPRWNSPYYMRANCHKELGQLDDAEADFSAAITAAVNESKDQIIAYIQRHGFYEALGRTEKARQDLAQFITLAEQWREKAEAPLDGDYLTIMQRLADAYLETGRVQEAIALHQQTLEKRKAKLGPDHPDTLISMNSLAVAYHSVGQLQEAIALFEQTLEKEKTKLAPDHPNTLISMNNLACAYREVGQLQEAIALHEQTLEKMKARLGPDHPETLRSMNNLAVAYQFAMKFDQADRLLRDLLQRRRMKDEPKSADTAAALASLGLNLLKQQRNVEAEPLLRECLAIYEQQLPGDWRRFNALSLLSGALLGQQKYAAAKPLLLQGYEGMKQREAQIRPPWKWRLAEAIERIVHFYEATQQQEKARAWRAKLTPEKAPGKKK